MGGGVGRGGLATLKKLHTETPVCYRKVGICTFLLQPLD